VEHGAPLLHAAVVTAPDDATLVHEDRTDWNAPLGTTQLRFFDGGVEERAHIRRDCSARRELVTAARRATGGRPALQFRADGLSDPPCR
jgi:hypothetical protein